MKSFTGFVFSFLFFVIIVSPLSSLLDEFDVEHSEITENPSKYFENPINAFKAIRRIVVDMPELVLQASKTWNLKGKYNHI